MITSSRKLLSVVIRWFRNSPFEKRLLRTKFQLLKFLIIAYSSNSAPLLYVPCTRPKTSNSKDINLPWLILFTSQKWLFTKNSKINSEQLTTKTKYLFTLDIFNFWQQRICSLQCLHGLQRSCIIEKHAHLTVCD